MYHYVRPLGRSRYPAIKGRDLEQFIAQLDHFRRQYSIVSFDDVIGCMLEHGELPPNPLVLTFDDGLVDHYTYVTPTLADAGLTGAFFPSSSATLERQLLNVHRLHFILASGADPTDIGSLIDEYVLAHPEDCGYVEDYRRRFALASRFDPADVVYVKRMLQTGMPANRRESLARDLFSRYVSRDELAFAEELYMTIEQLRLMRSVGMHIGSHGHAHDWLSHQAETDQRADMARSLGMLERVGVDTSMGWTICYPYGDFDDTTVSVARSLGCIAGLTIESRTADLTRDDPLRIPRLDTNELPFDRR
jgi:peptidoglycan/xylan/chitin deacetylase (PgdA/CDA1 family)